MAKDQPFRMWWLVVLTVAAVLPRLPLVQAGFSLEDPTYVQVAAESDGLISGMLEPGPSGYFRPIVSLYFDIFQRMFGEWAPGYHAMSIFAHVVIVWLVFLLCSRLAGFWPAGSVWGSRFCSPTHLERGHSLDGERRGSFGDGVRDQRGAFGAGGR